MLERRFFIPTKAIDIFEIEHKSQFAFIGDFDGGKIYHDISNENHDLYYVEHDLMSDNEKEKYMKMVDDDTTE